jgi:cytochrome c-type biogenesis protein CcmH
MVRALTSIFFMVLLAFTTTNHALSSAYENKTHPVDLFQFDSIQQQKEAIALAKTLRCPMCQNQNLIESNSAVAKDIRLKVFKLVQQGQSEQQIKEFMVERYGEHALYQPKFSRTNLFLWAAPLLLLVFVFGLAFVHIRKNC